MRPRGIPRGKHAASPPIGLQRQGFNEAAGNTPRKTARRSTRALEPAPLASMRPRGIPRGKPPALGADQGRRVGFNEAAGNTPRKTSYGGRFRRIFVRASMRPRGIPRGKRRQRQRRVRGRRASMRPRGIPRGKRLNEIAATGEVGIASMRPRGIPRGKPSDDRRRPHPATALQ